MVFCASTPLPVKATSYHLFSKQFPYCAKLRGLSVLLFLCGDVSQNPGTISFDVVNCRSVRNKGPMINDMISAHCILIITETHIRPNDIDALLKSVTPAYFKFHHKPRQNRRGGVVGFLIRNGVPVKIVGSPCFETFEHTIISVGSTKNVSRLSVYIAHLGRVQIPFLKSYLPSLSTSFLPAKLW